MRHILLGLIVATSLAHGQDEYDTQALQQMQTEQQFELVREMNGEPPCYDCRAFQMERMRRETQRLQWDIEDREDRRTGYKWGEGNGTDTGR